MIIVDANNLGFAATAGRPLHSGDLPTQGIFGFLTRLAEIRQQYAGKMVVLWDGRSWRYDYYPEYKGNRRVEVVEDDGTGVAAPAPAPSKSLQAMINLKAQWNLQIPYVAKLLRAMGVTQLKAGNMEADDLAARLVRLAPNEHHLLVTGDKDWKQLVAPNATWYCPIQYQRKPGTKPKPNKITPANFEEATGCRTPWDFVQVKALTGDLGDNIPGVGGIGPVNAKYILDNHGSVQALFNQAMISTAGKWPKAVLDFASDDDKRHAFHFNLLMVWLNHPDAPPTQAPIAVKGPQIPEAFDDICGELAFTSILNKRDRILDLFNPDAKDNN